MSLKLFLYNLPLKKPFQWGIHQIKERHGLIAVYHRDKTPYSVGEIAPLPGYSPFPLNQVISKIKGQLKEIESILEKTAAFDEWNDQMSRLDLPPSARYGLDTLFITRNAMHKESTCQHILFKKPQSSIALNGTLGLQDKQKLLEKTRKLYDKGYRTFKCKVGQNIEREYEALSELRQTYSEITLRIDANGRWTFEKAKQNLARLEPLNIQFCEQPVAADKWKEIAWLSQNSPISIAVDESLTDLDSIGRAIEFSLAPNFVVKPMRFGAVRDIIQFFQSAEKNGIRVIISSLLDSAIARHMHAVLASGLNESEIAHGLATGDIFKQDISALDHNIESGSLHLPNNGREFYSLLNSVNYSGLTPLT